MRHPFLWKACAAVLVALAGAGGSAGISGAQQDANTRPDLRGIWLVRGTANVNLEGHPGSAGVEAWPSVIVSPPTGKIPYRPEALVSRGVVSAADDPQLKCFAPGVPRAAYTPRPLQIFQTDGYVAIVYEELSKTRVIQMTPREHRDGVELWMGDTVGRWEGSTLVADVRALGGDTWFDMAGHFHSADMRVVERYTRTAPNTLQYEATMEDAQVFSSPWTIRLTLDRQTAPGFRIGYDECATDQSGRRIDTKPLR